MKKSRLRTNFGIGVLVGISLVGAMFSSGWVLATPAGQYRVSIEKSKVESSAQQVDMSWLVDEQLDVGDPPSGSPESAWKSHARKFPLSTMIDLGAVIPVSTLWIYDTNGKGDVFVEAGGPGVWSGVATYDCGKYKTWVAIPVEKETRYLRLTIKDGSANFAEIAVDAYSPKGWASIAAAKAEAERKAQERAVAMRKAKEEALKRPQVKVEPYGTLSLVEEIDMAAIGADRLTVSPPEASHVENILGRPARVLESVPGEAAIMTVRIGRMKMLRPGAAYVLSVEYPEDGFDVTIAQFEKGNDPLSKGAAVGRICLYEVIDEGALALKINFPPEGLPRRHLFWREEMADGVIGSKKPENRGVDDPIEWYRHKADLMRFLGMNTYAKDLLEFSACQGWDSTPYGGNKWVYFNFEMRGLWAQIVELMGQYGFDILPYYEYSGSKGREGLGNKRLAKPLTWNVQARTACRRRPWRWPTAIQP